MTIGVRFPDGPFDPVARIQQAVDAALTGYQTQLDARMRALLDAGIALERISIVALSGCETCRGSGITTTVDQGQWQRSAGLDAKIIVTISECPHCPGICVDGKRIDRAPTRGT